MIATWIYLDTEETASFFPQIGAQSDGAKVQAIYWRCIACFYALSVRFNPNERHVLYTNGMVPHDLDGFGLSDYLSKLNVEVRSLALSYRVPETWSKSFRNQFYLFDVIHDFAVEGSPGEWLCILDSDCVFVRDAMPLRNLVNQAGAGTYRCYETADDELTNGLRESDMARLGSDLSLQYPEDRIDYAGGEFFGTTWEAARSIDTLSRPTFSRLTEMNVKDSTFYCDEAHMLSMICQHLGFNNGLGNSFIRRIWTQFQHQNAVSDDMNLAIWHVPAEKKYGYLDLFARLKREGLNFGTNLSDDCLRTDLAKVFGIPGMSLEKKMKDLYRALSYRAARSLKKS